jgi:hypothetical protein
MVDLFPYLIQKMGVVMRRFFVITVIAFSLSLFGCNKNNASATGPETEPDNNVNNGAPSISLTTPADSTMDLALSGSVQFSVTATDPDNDPLTYTWSVSGGTIASNGSSHMDWTAPAITGVQTVKVSISDGKGHTITNSWSVGVGIIHVQGSISAFTTWKTGNVYIVSNWLSVDATLLIEPGVSVKFRADAYLDVTSNGTVNSRGTASKPITFSSDKDTPSRGD